MQTVCYCGSKRLFSDCCLPYIQGLKTAPDAEALMRSRYSAYATGAMDYILSTYAKVQRNKLSLQDLQGDDTHWCKLDVLKAKNKGDKAQVEFCAYSQQGSNYFLLHELSDFCKEDRQWRYVQGHIYADSGAYAQKRNDPCLCNSGLKFKKCCGLA
jgi:SEC-C motif-containing protein